MKIPTIEDFENYTADEIQEAYDKNFDSHIAREIAEAKENDN